jgi:hypothetical protein
LSDDDRSFVNDIQEIGGETYICFNYWEVSLLPRLHKLNKTTKKFEPVEELKFDREFFLHDLGNGKVFIFGHYFDGQDKNGVKELNRGSIWDINQQTLSAVQGTGPSNPGLGGMYYGHSVGLDKSLFIIVNSRIRVMHYGSTEWKDSEYPSFIVRGQFEKVIAFSKENVYAIWRRDSDAVHILLHLKNRKWEPLAEISYQDPQSSVSLDFVVTSLEEYKGKLIISHTGSHINGIPIGQIAVYDTTTKTWSSLPVPFALNTRSKFGESYVKVVGDSVYLVEKNGFLIFGVQTVWLLEHDGLLPIVLKSFSGRSESGTHKLFWESEVEQNFSHYEVQASKEGAVFETVREVQGKGPGMYTLELKTSGKTFYRLKMVDKDGLFKYSGVVVLNASVGSGRVYPNPTTGNVLVEVKQHQGTLEVYDILGKKLQSQTVSPGMYQINLANYANGMYLIQLFVEGKLQTTYKILKNQ